MDNSENTNQELSQRLLENRDVLFSYIMALVRDFNSAEDIFQEVALIILRKEKEGIEVEHFGAWSREIARRHILDFWKKNRKDEKRLLSEETLKSIDGEFKRREYEKPAKISELLHKLKRCLDKLPDHLRVLVDLRYTSKLSFREIGKQVSRSAGAAQVMLTRTRQRLLDCIEKFNSLHRSSEHEA
jgi:RNA polymerase sigma factor (sigma-70 family)